MAMIQLDSPASVVSFAYIHLEIKTFKPHQLDGISVALVDPIASIVKIPPPTKPPASDVTYDKLDYTDVDREKITHLISTIGENGKLTLLFKYQKELRQIGRDIDHVHPLKFLSTIMVNPILKGHLREIYKDYFKWTNILDGLGNGLTIQDKQGKVSCYIDDFAKEIKVNPESLQNYVKSQDWENMVIFLMNN